MYTFSEWHFHLYIERDFSKCSDKKDPNYYLSTKLIALIILKEILQKSNNESLLL